MFVLAFLAANTLLAQEFKNAGRDRWLVVNDPRLQLRLDNYQPEVGDIVLSATKNQPVRELFQLTTGSETTHVNIVVPCPEDGRPMILDVNRNVPVRLVEPKDFLSDEEREFVIRRCLAPRSEAQKAAMSQFAKDQLEKKYPTDGILVKEIYQALPVVPEALDFVTGGQIEKWREKLGVRKTWFCSQIVVAEAQVGELINRKVNPSAVRPVDLFHADNPNWDFPQRLWRIKPKKGG